MFATQLADVARRTGFPVVEVDGWQTRTTHDAPNGLITVEGVVCHHTGGPLGTAAASLGTVVNGRPDLSGPLSNYLLARDGTIYVVAAGKCNHAGDVNDPRFQNSHSVGIEGENKGDGTEPWSLVQMVVYRSLCHELTVEFKLSPEMVRGHKEVATNPPGRKSDPNFDMVAFRRTMQQEEDPVSDFVAGRVWGDIAGVSSTLIARAQRAGKRGNFSISVQSGHRTYAKSLELWNGYQKRLNWSGGYNDPRNPWIGYNLAAYPGASHHCGHAPLYDVGFAIDLTIHFPDGGTTNGRDPRVRHFLYEAGLTDPVASENWHWECKEGLYPPVEQPDPVVDVLKVGSTGDAVKVLQQRINYLMRGQVGFPIAEDGSYGTGTAKAVAAYQNSHPGLKPDGVAGPMTLNSVTFFYVLAENRYSGYATVKINDVGHPTEVHAAQAICSLMGVPTAQDGKFGPGTEASVKTVQLKWGLAADGVCGPQFWAKADDLMDFIGKPN